MSDEKDKKHDWMIMREGESLPPHMAGGTGPSPRVATLFRGDPARANSRYRAAVSLREEARERIAEQGPVFGALLDHIEILKRAREAYYLAFARDWGPSRDEPHLELSLFVKQVYLELLEYAAELRQELPVE